MRPVDWQSLDHAYGSAANIAALLRDAGAFPAEADWKAEPWFSLWSSLCHQGEIYSASIAAVPCLIDLLQRDPGRATLSFFLLPASIAIADHANPVPVPPDVRGEFVQSLSVLGDVAASLLPVLRDTDMRRAAEAAILVSRGAFSGASAVLEEDA